MALNHPYIIYGTVKNNGVPQASVNVTVKNETTNEQHTVQTNSEGKYIVTITRTDWYPSGASNGDNIKVITSFLEITTQVDTTNYPTGRRVDFNEISVSDSGSGADSLQLQTNLSLNDSGQGSEVFSLAVDLSISEVGSGSDSLASQASLAISDSGSGTDFLQQQASLFLSDSGQGSDNVPFPEVSLTLSEAGVTSEQLSLTVDLGTISDVGSGSDTISLQSYFVIADLGSGVENLPYPTVEVTVNEVGNGVEGLALIVTVPTIVDGGEGMELIAVSAPSIIEIADLAQGNDVVIVETPITVADIGSAVENVLFTVTCQITEEASSTEIVDVSYTLQITDSAAGSELVTTEIGVTYITVSDVFTVEETISIGNEFAVQDAGSGLEALVVTTGELVFVLPLKVKVKVNV